MTVTTSELCQQYLVAPAAAVVDLTLFKAQDVWTYRYRSTLYIRLSVKRTALNVFPAKPFSAYVS